jgi:hypothetical protein
LLTTFDWAGGASGDFNDSSNWLNNSVSPPAHGVPGASDVARVSSPIGATLTSTQSNTVGILQAGLAILHITGGTFTVRDGDNPNPGAPNLAGLTVASGTTFRVHSGAFLVTAGLSSVNVFQGTFDVQAGAHLELRGTAGEYDVDLGTTFTGLGSYFVSGGPFNINADVTAPQNFELGLMASSTGNLSGAGKFMVPAGATFTWSGGTMSGPGTTAIATGATFQIASGATTMTLDSRTLTNAGAGTWSGTGNISLRNAAIFNNLSGGTFAIQNDQDIMNDGTVLNAGVISKNSSGFTKVFATAFTNTGTVNVLDGTLEFTVPALTNSGTIVLAPPATLSVRNFDYTQTAAGALTIQIGGSPASGQFGRANVGAVARLAGTLNVALVGGFNPAPADAFRVMTFSSRSGDFDLKNGLNLGNGRRFTTVYDAISLTLQQVALNHPPVLNPIADQVIDEGRTLTFTATASDPDIPANVLTFSLDPGAPAGATIDPVTGAFSWTPPPGAADASFTIRVTDNGSPALSDTQQFRVHVLPRLVTITSARVQKIALSKRKKTTGIVLKVSGELDATTARNLANFRLASAGRDKKFGTKDDKLIKLRSANFDATISQITLIPRGRLNVSQPLQLTITGLADSLGRLFDGDRNGQPGGTFVAVITRKGVSAIGSTT